MQRFIFKMVENIVGEGENAGQHFSPLGKYISILSGTGKTSTNILFR